jgi:hypothetical protein
LNFWNGGDFAGKNCQKEPKNRGKSPFWRGIQGRRKPPPGEKVLNFKNVKFLQYFAIIFQ